MDVYVAAECFECRNISYSSRRICNFDFVICFGREYKNFQIFTQPRFNRNFTNSCSRNFSSKKRRDYTATELKKHVQIEISPETKM